MTDGVLELNDGTERFQKGDRVVVSVVGQRRHGHVIAVGSQTCAIHLDTGDGKAQFQTVLVPPHRMKREQQSNHDEMMPVLPLSCTIQNRATVSNGVLVHGSAIHDGCHTIIYNAAAMNGIMHMIRWMVATHVIPRNTNSSDDTKKYSNLPLGQIQQLPSQDCLKLNEIAIQNWEHRIDLSKEHNDNATVTNTATKTTVSPQPIDSRSGGVHNLLVQYFQSQNITSGFIWESLSDSRAIRSWHRCIQSDFWFVAKDDMGTYIVPDCRSHEHVVYKVIGFGGPMPMASSQSSPPAVTVSDNPSTHQAPVRMIRIPMCLRITILPWYGRLLHDTSIPLSKESVRKVTDPMTANRLHTVVLHAIQNGTVLEHFAELEK
jgi:hypothetical protein